MLTAETKRRINSARDILVGQLPLPTDQVELITIALIYKFMDDIDEESRSIGGRATFFTGDLRDLSWRHIISNTLSADARVIKLTQGIEAISDPKNTQIPELFKSIFRNAFLKFRDGRTLKLFLDEIKGFTYDHSEELGNAFEFILESMGVQADNGQFRTPRNIIEFIVDVVDPQKDETILDPACGTAGFLISAYKHIMAANTSAKAAEKNPYAGDLLKGNQRDKLTRNVVGYDITPLMCRLSRVNMYLHHFSNPVIHEYDTLTNKNRWDDKADIILANPPFMTPKGGIRPHDRFAISANRSEVLFVDYIAEHLNPAGRAGVIVPEGIIFQSQNAYKELRRMLVDGFLWAVVSLPAGVFNPYSGVKTSILFLDRTRAKQNDEVLFVKAENDGFGLGAQRREIELNDLPEALKIIKTWKRDHKVADGKLAHAVSRKRILESPDISLSGDRYRAVAIRGNGKWPVVKLEEVCEINPSKSELNDLDKALEVSFVPMSAMGENQPSFEAVEKKPLREVLKGYTYFRDRDVLFAKITPCFENGKAGIARGLNNGIGFGSTEFIVLRPDNKRLLPELLYFFIASDTFRSRGVVHMTGSAGQQRVASSFVQSYKIPLPPMAEQERLVAELEGYRRVIESARQILAHYKPTLRLNPAWPLVELSSIATFKNGKGEGIKVIGVSNFQDNLLAPIDELDQINPQGVVSDSDILHDGDILFVRSNGNKALVGRSLLVQPKQERLTHSAFTIRLRFTDKKALPLFYTFLFKNPDYRTQLMGRGTNISNLSQDILREIVVPLPPLAEQRALVAELETERSLVEANRELAARFEQKLQTKLSEIWGAQS
jgi:type I restriction enzyme M protein